MLMSVVENAVLGEKSTRIYPELAGKRILITGVSRKIGVELVTALADHQARLIINYADDCAEMQALSELITPVARDVRVYNDALATADDVARFTRTAAQIYGGLDAVVNFLALPANEIAPSADFDDVERYVSDKLLAPSLISTISANRMALTWSEGIVLNVVVMESGSGQKNASNADIAIAGVIKAALTAMTRKQSQEWAKQGIRINAVTPRVVNNGEAPAGETNGETLSSDTDIAALALYLISKRGAKLTGHIFDAEGAARNDC